MHFSRTTLAFIFTLIVAYIGLRDTAAAQIGIGIKLSYDGNFYHFYNGKFSDFDGVTKISSGFTYGSYVAITASKRIQFDLGYNRSEKKYHPERLFSFGILQSIEIRSIEITSHISYYLNNETTTWQKYVLFGIIYERETPVIRIYKQHTGEDPFTTTSQFLTGKVGLGVSRFISKNNRLRLHSALILSLGRFRSEYRHPILNKVSLNFGFEYRIFS